MKKVDRLIDHTKVSFTGAVKSLKRDLKTTAVTTVSKGVLGKGLKMPETANAWQAFHRGDSSPVNPKKVAQEITVTGNGLLKGGLEPVAKKLVQLGGEELRKRVDDHVDPKLYPDLNAAIKANIQEGTDLTDSAVTDFIRDALKAPTAPSKAPKWQLSWEAQKDLTRLALVTGSREYTSVVAKAAFETFEGHALLQNFSVAAIQFVGNEFANLEKEPLSKDTFVKIGVGLFKGFLGFCTSAFSEMLDRSRQEGYTPNGIL
ncbi:MAG: hypothetical protein AB7F31_02125 [Parachlamydiales bacterium]